MKTDNSWKQPNLIQRAMVKEIAKADVTGIDCLLNYEYMGSAEFEFGALPMSLKKIAHEFDSYKRFSTKFSDGTNTVHIICKPEFKESILEFLDRASKESYGHKTKEIVYFKEALGGERETRVWWDLDNHWFAVLGKDTAKKIMIGIQKFKERKGL